MHLHKKAQNCTFYIRERIYAQKIETIVEPVLVKTPLVSLYLLFENIWQEYQVIESSFHNSYHESHYVDQEYHSKKYGYQNDLYIKTEQSH